jgi:hypothetical protein
MMEDHLVPAGSDQASPKVRYVGIATRTTKNRYLKGGGHLAIGPDALSCKLTKSTARLAGFEYVAHIGSVVHVYHQRGFPFWLNVNVVVENGSSKVCAGTWTFALRSLLAELHDAGFTVNVHRTWFYGGMHYFEKARTV